MSGSEGKQQNNSQMSKRDIEEEEMAQELMNMEMYEVGMDYEQMKEILRFINESKNMAGIEPDNRSSQESTKYPEEILAPAELLSQTNSRRELIAEENSIPKPSFSYRQNTGRGSPSIMGHKSTLDMVPVEEMSVGSPEMFDNEEEPKRFGGEGESVFDKLVKATETTDENEEIVKSRSQQSQGKNSWHTASDSSQNSHNSLSLDNQRVDNAKSKKNQRVERWKLDPTNAVVDENDVPLQEKTRPLLNERVPYNFCHDRRAVFDSTVGDKVLTVLTHALEEVADLWRRKHRPDVSEFQWGSPIKVGANKRGLDKNPIIEEADSPERCEILRNIIPDSAQRRNMDRNYKRKAAEHISHLENEHRVDSDTDDENIFEKIKKVKKNDGAWQPRTKSNLNSSSSEKSLTRQDKIFNNLHNLNKIEDDPVIEDYDSDDLDLDDLRSLRKKNKNKNEELTEEYPRRIPPPNPSKPKVVRRPRKNGEKRKKKSPVGKNTQAVLEPGKNSGLSVSRGGRSRNPLAKQNSKETLTLNDEEIMTELEETNVDVEIKPLPVRELSLAGKLQHGASMLLGIKKAEEKMERSRIQEQLEVEKEEKKRKQDLARARSNKEKEEREEREAKELIRKAKEEAWRKNEAARDRDRRRRQAQEKKQAAAAGQGVVLTDEEEAEDVDSFIGGIDVKQAAMEDRVQCPICLLEFSNREIQGHAADCDQFDNVDNPGTSGSPVDDNDELTITNEHAIYDCHICSHFSTTNGNVFELHVRDCVSRSKDLLGSPAKEVVEVPTSPIRCFVPISEQTESEINYAEQFPEQKVKPNGQRMKRRQ